MPRSLAVALDEHLSSLLFRVSNFGGLMRYGSRGPCAEERAVWVVAYVRRLSIVLGRGNACVAADYLGLITEPDRVETRSDCSVGDTGGVEQIPGT